MPNFDPVRLEVFKHLFASVAEEMGMVLRRTGYSPNIKERRDFSCAIFDQAGRMIAQAAHIPVHLGSMPLSVDAGIKAFEFSPGDVVILNDPFRGGTHLPDITLITPVFIDHGQDVLGFSANRAHHSDVGGMTPGSMPLSHELYQEGVIIPPLKLIEGGEINQGLFDLLLANVRTPDEREGDIRAQIAANQRGVTRMGELVARYGRQQIEKYMSGLLEYAERMTRRLIEGIPDGVYRYHDFMDDDGMDPEPAKIAVEITIQGDEAVIDFAGTSPQRRGSINAVYAITLSATQYVFRTLIGMDIPSNSGCLAPIKVIAPEGSLVNARSPAAVAGGNVETSQRIVDVLLGALAKACPERVPAASQGTMNNLTIGGWDSKRDRPFAYYETVGGGMGACPGMDGADAIHTHMTNTMNTPIEALEYTYPFRIRRYEIRRGSGGEGRYRGGNGIIREIELLENSQVTILSERRRFEPYGLEGGDPGLPGRNILISDGEERELPGKVSCEVNAGDIISLQTPGGGGYGERSKRR
ncbi:MAG TPA: hydantoinase B/oxoprolinase family protein [Anaerolineae bacterium]|nr:hydantoinase B/oxoprolinase family protein [Anaerolineae bacterium]